MCIFCKIITREIPAEIIYEDDDLIAFPDINPKAPVHILLIPKEHVASVDHLDNFEIIGKLAAVAKKIATEKNINQAGYRLVFNSGRDAGQEVDHLHLHLIGGGKLGGLV